jgi:hypothetical protein
MFDNNGVQIVQTYPNLQIMISFGWQATTIILILHYRFLRLFFRQIATFWEDCFKNSYIFTQTISPDQCNESFVTILFLEIVKVNF